MLRLVLGFLVPTAFLVVGFLAKTIIRPGRPRISWPDLYLGTEWTVAAVTLCILNACDLYRLGQNARTEQETIEKKAQTLGQIEEARCRRRYVDESLEDNRQEQGRNTAILASAVLLFLVAAFIHRRWEPEPDSCRKRALMAGCANFCGYAPMALYMLYVKGL